MVKVIPAITYGDLDAWRKKHTKKTNETYLQLFFDVINKSQINYILLAINQQQFSKVLSVKETGITIRYQFNIPKTIGVFFDHGIFVSRNSWIQYTGTEKNYKNVSDIYLSNEADVGLALDYPVNMLDDILRDKVRIDVLKEFFANNGENSESNLLKIINKLESRNYIPPFLDYLTKELHIKIQNYEIGFFINKSGKLKNKNIVEFVSKEISQYYKNKAKDLMISETINETKKMVQYFNEVEGFKITNLCPVIQGYDKKSIERCINEYSKLTKKTPMGIFNYLSLGTAGKATKTEKEAQELLNHVEIALSKAKRLMPNVWFHVLGVSKYSILKKFKEMGVDSVDSTRFLRMGIDLKRAKIVGPYLKEFKISTSEAVNISKNCECSLCKNHGKKIVEVRLSKSKLHKNQKIINKSINFIEQEEVKLLEKKIRDAIVFKDLSRRGDVRLFHNLAMQNEELNNSKEIFGTNL